MKYRINKFTSLALAGLGLLWTGCAEDEASLKVMLESEDTIVQGLAPGAGAENIRDGWSVNFERFLAVVGPIELKSATDPNRSASSSQVHLVDLKQVPAGGLPLWTLEAPEGRWEFRYDTPGATAGFVKHANVTPQDAEVMRANNWTYHVIGALTKTDGQSCPPLALAKPGAKQSNGKKSGNNPCYAAPTVRFDIGATAATEFGPCEVDGIPGVALSSAKELSVAVTIHGDHLFFNGFPEGDEGGVMRLAQWLADCDLNLDGLVTKEELAAIAPTQLPEVNGRYQLGGSPITPLTNMYQFATAQFKTQGHFQGEGECPVDGKAHDHGHGHGHDH